MANDKKPNPEEATELDLAPVSDPPAPQKASPLAEVEKKLGVKKKDGDSTFDIDLPGPTASSSHLFGTENPTAEGLSDTGLVNLDPFAPVKPATGWFDTQAEVPYTPAAPAPTTEADLAAPASGIIGGSDIFGAPVPAAQPKSDVSDVIAATAYSPATPVVEPGRPAQPRGSDVALNFDRPPGGSTVESATANEDLPIAQSAEDSLFGGEEDVDSARIARVPNLPGDAADLGSAPAGGVDASSILADLSSSGSAPGDSSAIRLEAPGMKPTHRGGDSSHHRMRRESTELDIDLPEGGDATDWRSHSDSDLFADNRTQPEFELRPEAGDVDPFGDELTPGQPPPSSIFSEAQLATLPPAPVPNPESGDAVEFSDHPDPKQADSGSFHVLPAGRLRTPTPVEDDDWAHAKTDPGPGASGILSSRKKLDPTDEMAPIPSTPVKGKAAKKDSKAVVNWADSAEEMEAPSRSAAAKRREPEAEGVSRRGFAGLALGLLLGVGASAGVYFSGAIPNKDGQTQTQPGPGTVFGGTPPQNGGPGTGTGLQVTSGNPQEALDSGDPARALKLIEASGAKTASEKATLGQARLFARFRELANANATAAADDAEISKARTDLEAAMNDPDAAANPEAEKTAVKAALHLGLSHEASGDRTKAKAVYEDGLKKFPKAAEFFRTALDRLAATDPGSNRTSRLTPAEAEQLATAVAIMLVLNPVPKEAAPAPAAPEPGEAGTAFWKAVNAAAAGKYDDAAKHVAEAKAAHEKRAKALAGRGLNPLTDPLEQIFPRCCDDLKAYWELRKALYEHPGVGAAVKKDGVTKTLDALAGAEKRAIDQAKLAADLKTSNDTLAADLKTEKEKSAKSDKDLVAEKDKVVKLEKDIKAEKDKIASYMKAVDDLKDAYKKDMANARADLSKRDDQIDALKLALRKSDVAIEELKERFAAVGNSLVAAKLLPEKHDSKELIAAVKSVVSRATGPDLTKLIPADLSSVAGTGLTTGHILDLASRTNKSEAAAKAATAEISKIKAEQTEEIKSMTALLKKTTQDLKDEHAADLKKSADVLAAEKKKTDAESKLKEAAERKAGDAQKAADSQTDRVAALTASLATERARTSEAERKLKALGGATALAAQELDRQAQEAAARSLDTGIKEYKAGRYTAAATALEAAAKHDPNDAIAWYYLGATRWAQGKTDDATTAYKQGAERESLRLVPAKQVETLIGAIQGAARDALTAARP